ncbi:MAG: hypothetical protein ABI639_13275 [Thermoanaerobaculia bacterium]
MKTWKNVTAGAVLGVSLAAASFAAAPAAKANHCSGKVDAVNAQAMSIDLTVAGKSEKVTWDAQTAVVENGQTVAASKLAAGESVKVTWAEKAGQKVASRIEILPAAAASAMKPAAKPGH